MFQKSLIVVGELRGRKRKKKKKEMAKGLVERLSTYLNCLVEFKEEGYKYITSQELGDCVGVNPAEVRRDLGNFGAFGKKGVGYPIDVLISTIKEALGAVEKQKVALVGAGNLGTAIVEYEGLKKHGFYIDAVFDADPKKIGRKINGIEIKDVRKLKNIIKRRKIQIGIIAVPENAAQKVADMLVEAGVKVIINYAPIFINVPKGVKVHNTNPAVELLHTLYFLSRAFK
jgi:redox-sensing transcriptional repressor